MKIEYVLGFAFDHHGRVAMIQKSKPEWQSGDWNGVGGKVELHETLREAMEREFLEKTGVHIKSVDWRLFAEVRGNGYMVRCYTTQSAIVADVKTTTEEPIRLFSCSSFERLQGKIVPNVPLLIQAARLKPDRAGGKPYLILDYT